MQSLDIILEIVYYIIIRSEIRKEWFIMEENRTRVEQLIISRELNTNNMYNKERKLQFIQDIYGNYNDVTDETIATVIQLFNQFGKGENSFGKDFFDMNTSEFIKFFEYFQWSRNSISQKKSFIKSYLTWGYNNGLIDIQVIRELEEVKNDNVSKKDAFEKYYFQYFKDLVKGMQYTVSTLSNDVRQIEESTRLQTSEVAIYLAWFGVKMVDICKIRKQDINEKHNQIYIQSIDSYINIPEDIMKDIVFYRDAEGYIARDKHNNIHEYEFRNSEILLRTQSLSKFTELGLSTLISKYFNYKKAESPKVISYQRVFWSGVYCRAHEYEITHERFSGKDVKTMSRVFHEQYNSPSRVSARLADYRDYCKHFYPKEEYKY